jgi:hypothetical protein
VHIGAAIRPTADTDATAAWVPECGTAGLHDDGQRRNVDQRLGERRAAQSPPQDHPAVDIFIAEHEYVFCEIDGNRASAICPSTDYMTTEQRHPGTKNPFLNCTELSSHGKRVGPRGRKADNYAGRVDRLNV